MDKIQFEDKLAQRRSTSNLFKYFKAFRKSKLPPKMFYNEFNADSDKDKADLFAKFSSLVSSKSSSFKFSCDLSADMPVLKEVSIETKEEMEVCKNSNVNKSKGPDEIPPFLVHKLCISLSPSLTQIYRKILQTDEYSKSWKIATVSALHKKNDKCDVSNYHPVSLLSISSKILERILFIRLYNHYSQYLHSSQFGYRRNRSTITQLLTFLQKVYNDIENQKEIDVIFTDYSKAFDSVDHGVLLKKTS